MTVNECISKRTLLKKSRLVFINETSGQECTFTGMGNQSDCNDITITVQIVVDYFLIELSVDVIGNKLTEEFIGNKGSAGMCRHSYKTWTLVSKKVPVKDEIHSFCLETGSLNNCLGNLYVNLITFPFQFTMMHCNRNLRKKHDVSTKHADLQNPCSR